jgi:hypothetical protein
MTNQIRMTKHETASEGPPVAFGWGFVLVSLFVIFFEAAEITVLDITSADVYTRCRHATF